MDSRWRNVIILVVVVLAVAILVVHPWDTGIKTGPQSPQVSLASLFSKYYSAQALVGLEAASADTQKLASFAQELDTISQDTNGSDAVASVYYAQIAHLKLSEFSAEKKLDSIAADTSTLCQNYDGLLALDGNYFDLDATYKGIEGLRNSQLAQESVAVLDENYYSNLYANFAAYKNFVFSSCKAYEVMGDSQ